MRRAVRVPFVVPKVGTMGMAVLLVLMVAGPLSAAPVGLTQANLPKDTLDSSLCDRPFAWFVLEPDVSSRVFATRLLEGLYPLRLQEQGLDGAVELDVFLDGAGEVGEVRVATTSGNQDLDAAAVTAAQNLRFDPAMNRERREPIWVTLPVVFSTGEVGGSMAVPSLSDEVRKWKAKAAEPAGLAPAPSSFGLLRGRVTDPASGEPIPHAQVLVAGSEIGVVSDGEGNFAFRCVPAGDLEVAAFHLGRELAIGQVNVPEDDWGELDLQLPARSIRLDRLVVLAEGARDDVEEETRPVGDFSVYLRDPLVRNRHDIRHVLEAAYSALLRDRSTEGTVELWLRLDSEGDVINWMVNRSARDVILDSMAGLISGIVEFESGWTRDKSSSVWVSQPIIFTTDPEVDPDRIEDSYVRARESRKSLTHPEWRELRGRREGAIIGTVTGSVSGEPISGAQVFLSGSAWGDVTDQHGRFFLRDVPVGEWGVMAALIGNRLETGTVTVAPGELTRIDFQLEAEVIPLQPIVIRGGGR